MIPRIAALLAALLWPAVAPGWDLDPAASSLSVVSVKNGDVAETHRFTGLTGAVADNGAALVAISLGSIETGIDIRDERMRTMLFDLAAHPFALVSARVDLAALEATPVGAVRLIAAPVSIEANGRRVEAAVRLVIERLGADRVVIATVEPVVIDAQSIGFASGIEALRRIAGLDAIAPALPVSATLVFTR
jgi:hypothetical protein